MMNLFFYRIGLQNQDPRYLSNGCVQFIELSDRQQITKKGIYYRKEVKEIRWDIREAITPYFPENAVDEVTSMIFKHKVILFITTPLKETLGVYSNGIIRINNDLAPNRFLEVFLHEYAHLLQRIPFYRATPVHGAEFYYCLEQLVLFFIQKKILPDERFLPIVNYKDNYNFFKNNGLTLSKRSEGFRFLLNSTSIGTHVTYNNEVFIRGKGIRGQIECTRISDNTKFKLDPRTEIVPVLDFSW